MIHIKNSKRKTKSVCDSVFNAEKDSLTDVAFESDCDKCRSLIGICKQNDTLYNGKKAGVTKKLQLDPKPYNDLEPLKEIVKRRNGL